jgi:CysZ protein
LSYPLRAIRMLQKNPRLWGYLITPIFVNLVLGIGIYSAGIYFGWQFLEQLTLTVSVWADQWVATLPQWLGFVTYFVVGMAWVLRVILIMGLLVITGFILSQFGVLLGSPWYGQLSEQLEKIRTGNTVTIEVGIVRDIGRAIAFELKKIILGVGFGLFLLLLNFIPGVGTLGASVGGVLITAVLTGLDFLDAPSERRRFRFRRKLRILFTSLPASGSFAVVCLGLVSIPLVNLVTIPICVAGGTLFWCDRVLPYLPREQVRGNRE